MKLAKQSRNETLLMFCFLAFIVFVAATWRNKDEYIIYMNIYMNICMNIYIYEYIIYAINSFRDFFYTNVKCTMPRLLN